jgi:hypothetical protein
MTTKEKMTITKYDLLYEQRMTRVETTLEEGIRYIRKVSKDTKSEFRWIVIIMLGGFGTLFGLMARGFKWF